MTRPNNLINEQSPYLLQHAYNPVNWYPWGDDAFKKAKEEDKPIFLSVGYATCHWCHVMEHESFEDSDVATSLNDNFISIKVDREERPDIDSIYMTITQMMTGRGGWPMTIIMTSDKKPFFAGTYIPKEGRFGMTGLIDLLSQITEIWKTKRQDVHQTAEQVTKHLQESSTLTQTEYNGEELIIRGFDELNSKYDEILGGFGSQPKFPSPHNLLFLMRYWKRYNDGVALQMVEKTLQKMRMGGIYDHVGFGFHRYSTDRHWLVPHFEKMLYDQAMLVLAYTEAYQITKKEIYKETAEEILEYVMRDMTSPEGGFYSAEDADSEGEEGKFYIWSYKEITKILSKDELELAARIFNILPTGNFLDEATQQKSTLNILHLKRPIKELLEELNISKKEFDVKIEIIREKLFSQRKQRIHPLKDDKILTDWNGLMIAAFSKASRILRNKSYQQTAEKAIDFILAKLQQEDGRLLHRYRNEDAAIMANLDDYAFMIWGLLELYETSFNPKYLNEAINLNVKLIDHFWDNESGGFFFTPDDGEELLVREKPVYDGSIPSGNSVAMLNLVKLSKMTSEASLEQKADDLMKTFAKQINRIPSAFSFILSSLDFALGPSFEIIL
ncbi:MAG: Cellobiose 2-epimerase, partial [Candidatus Heimdallarchaeota archaeon AB_125]